MIEIGLTKARSMGDVAAAVERAGGSVARVFRNAELPVRLVDEPEQLILLRDQLVLVECAARELGDETLPLRLSMRGGVKTLGAFGEHMLAAQTLREAIIRCNYCITSMLQTMTRMTVVRKGEHAIWTYEILDRATIGRQKNELLALGYMAETLKCFGANNLLCAALPNSPPARMRLEEMLGCDIIVGKRAGLWFPAEYLDMFKSVRAETDGFNAAPMPLSVDFSSTVEHLVKLAMLDQYPTLEFVCRRLSLPARSLQRRLAEHQQSFESIRRRVLVSHAESYLRDGTTPIIQIAYSLGYSDPAHFTRAFVAWTGETPRARRRALLQEVGHVS